MKKLEKLTLKELEKESFVLTKDESSTLFGGEDADVLYFQRYGECVPAGCTYDPMNDTLFQASVATADSSDNRTEGTVITLVKYFNKLVNDLLSLPSSLQVPVLIIPSVWQQEDPLKGCGSM